MSNKGKKFRNDYSLIKSLSELLELSSGKYIILVFIRLKGAFPTNRKLFENEILPKMLEFNKEVKIPICWSNIAGNDVGPWLDKKTYGSFGCLLIKDGSVKMHYKYNSTTEETLIIKVIKSMYDMVKNDKEKEKNIS